MNWYGLWIIDSKKPGWVRAIDCAGDPILAYSTEWEAIQGRDAHETLYDILSEVRPLEIDE